MTQDELRRGLAFLHERARPDIDLSPEAERVGAELLHVLERAALEHEPSAGARQAAAAALSAARTRLAPAPAESFSGVLLRLGERFLET